MTPKQKLLAIWQHPNYAHLTWHGKPSRNAFTREIARSFECKSETVLTWLNDNNSRQPDQWHRHLIDGLYRKLIKGE